MPCCGSAEKCGKNPAGVAGKMQHCCNNGILEIIKRRVSRRNKINPEKGIKPLHNGKKRRICRQLYILTENHAIWLTIRSTKSRLLVEVPVSARFPKNTGTWLWKHSLLLHAYRCEYCKYKCLHDYAHFVSNRKGLAEGIKNCFADRTRM